MPRLVRAARLLLVIVAILIPVGASSQPASAQTPTGVFAALPSYSGSGLASVVYLGGTLDQLEAVAGRVGASGIWLQSSDGGFQLLVVAGPDFLKAAVRARFPAGFPGPQAVTLVKGGAPSAGTPPPPSIPTPVRTPTPVPTPSAPASNQVVSTCIESDFNGWSGDTVFELCNGDVVVQTDATLALALALRPDVLLVGDGTDWIMKVDGVSLPRFPGVFGCRAHHAASVVGAGLLS